MMSSLNFFSGSDAKPGRQNAFDASWGSRWMSTVKAKLLKSPPRELSCHFAVPYIRPRQLDRCLMDGGNIEKYRHSLCTSLVKVGTTVWWSGPLGLIVCRSVELCEAFSLFDKDGDGQITVKEVAQTMTSLGIDVRLSDIEVMVDQVDTDGQHFRFFTFTVCTYRLLQLKPTFQRSNFVGRWGCFFHMRYPSSKL